MDAPWDCIVIGGGAAGLSAALGLGRARRRVLLLDAAGQSNLRADHIGGLLGYDQRPAPELYAAGRRELAAYPSVTVRDARATAARKLEDGTFAVELATLGADDPRAAAEATVAAATEHAAHLLLATGADYRFAPVPGLAERFGQSVFHCPFCHGWEHRGEQLGVLDGSPVGVDRALMLRAWTDRVTLYTGGSATLDAAARERLAAGGVALEERELVAATGPGTTLAELQFASGAPRACTGLLVAVTLAQRGGLADALGIDRQTEGFWAGQTLAASPMGATNVPGVFAAGDACTANPSVAGAIASGAAAAAGIVHGSMVPPVLAAARP